MLFSIQMSMVNSNLLETIGLKTSNQTPGMICRFLTSYAQFHHPLCVLSLMSIMAQQDKTLSIASCSRAWKHAGSSP